MSAGVCPDWESFKTKHFLLPQVWPRLLAILGMAVAPHTAASQKGKLSIRFKLYIHSVFIPASRHTSSDRIKDKTYLKVDEKINI